MATVKLTARDLDTINSMEARAAKLGISVSQMLERDIQELKRQEQEDAHKDS